MDKNVRKVMAASIVTALGLFLALQYNETINEIFTKVLPETASIWIKIIYIVILTFLIVFLIIGVQKMLDGK
jgi:TRAP-type C4-dicarboxylate transport system permease small subunit